MNAGFSNAKALDGKAKVVGILGYPVSHSLSPVMHNACLEKMGINAVYVPFAVNPAAIKEALLGIRALHIQGVNVTIPHKETVIPFLDGLSEISRLSGTVNTIYRENDQLIGTTTDGYGALENLSAGGIQIQGKHVAVIGNGGSARAIGFALALRQKEGGGPKQISIWGRSAEKAGALRFELVTKVKGSEIVAGDLNRFQDHHRDIDIIINTTPLGMSPNIHESPLVIDDLLDHHVVYDIVYNPRETTLLKMARARGLNTVEGLGMLVHQGAKSFEIWFGQKPDTEVMFQALENYFGVKALSV